MDLFFIVPLIGYAVIAVTLSVAVVAWSHGKLDEPAQVEPSVDCDTCGESVAKSRTVEWTDAKRKDVQCKKCFEGNLWPKGWREKFQ